MEMVNCFYYSSQENKINPVFIRNQHIKPFFNFICVDDKSLSLFFC